MSKSINNSMDKHTKKPKTFVPRKTNKKKKKGKKTRKIRAINKGLKQQGFPQVLSDIVLDFHREKNPYDKF